MTQPGFHGCRYLAADLSFADVDHPIHHRRFGRDPTLGIGPKSATKVPDSGRRPGEVRDAPRRWGWTLVGAGDEGGVVMTMQELDADRVEAFAGRMLGVVNDGMLALMVSVGHRTGLFDAMAELDPADSSTIAAAAGLDERYVREWLGATVTGRIVEYDRARARTGCRPSTPRC